MEQEKTKNNGLIILIVILCLMVLGLGGYIAYDKVLSNNSTKQNDNTQSSAATNENNTNNGTIDDTNTTVDENNTDNSTTNDNVWNPVVTVKSFEIDSAKVVNAPNYHMTINGKFVLEGNYDDYLNVYFYGYCYDVDNNKYNIMAPSIGHKYDIGENRLDASEMLEYDYGKQYDIYTDNSSKKEWKEIKIKSCRFDKMTTTILKDGKSLQLSEEINFDKTFN